MWFEVAAVGCAEEGSINYYSTLLPADLESFAAEGAELHQSQHRLVAGAVGEQELPARVPGFHGRNGNRWLR